MPTRKEQAGWERSTIWAMLRNPAYRGMACFGKTGEASRQHRDNRAVRMRGHPARRAPRPLQETPKDQWIQIPVPALVDERTFDLAQERLQDNKKFSPRRTVEPNILQGLVHCARCGYALYRTSTRSSARKIYYYRCLGSDAWRYRGQARCSARPIRLDHTVWTEVARLLEDPALIQAELTRRVEAARTSHPAKQNQDRISCELLQAQRRVERLLTAYQEDLLSLDELRRRMPELRQRETRLKAELESLNAQLVDQATYLRLAHTLGEFLERLRTQAQGWTCWNASASSDYSSRRSSLATTTSQFDIQFRTPTGPPPQDHSIRARQRPAAMVREQVRYCVRGVISPLMSNLYMRRFVE